MNDLLTIPFEGGELLARRGEDARHTNVAMLSMVAGMGLSWKVQHRKITSHPVLAPTVTKMEMVTEDGKVRQVVSLPLSMIPFFLTTINPNNVKAELRPKIIAYQTRVGGSCEADKQGACKVARQLGTTEFIDHIASTIPAGDSELFQAVNIAGVTESVGTDVCERLGYADPTTAIKSHCRGVQKLHPIAYALGRMQKTRREVAQHGESETL